MHTYSHAIFTWAAARLTYRAAARAALWGAAGAALPDIPTLVKAANLLWGRRASMTKDEFLGAMEYFEEPSGRADLSLHSLVPEGALLGLYKVLGLEKMDSDKALLSFLVGWAGHNAVDFLTHSKDARPILWPLSQWRWMSPISYWDRECYAVPAMLVEHGVLLALAMSLLYESYKG